MPYRFVIAVLLLFAASPLCAAQQSAGEKPPTKPPASEEKEETVKTEVFTLAPGASSVPNALLNALKAVELPQGKDAWTVQVATRGGFTGRGRGGLVVVSDGRVACDPPGAACAERAPADALRSLDRAVLEAKPDKWGEFSVGMCHDCYQTLLVVRHRDKDGAEQVYMAFWDDTTQGDLPEEVRKIYEGALKLAVLQELLPQL